MASKRIDININSTNAGNGFKSAGSDLAKLKSEAGSTGQTIGQSIASGVRTATSSLSSLGTSASKTFNTIKAGASAARSSIGDMGTAISSLAGGLGAMQVAQAMWTGSTQKQFNQAYLQTKMSAQAANDYILNIQKIVAEAPGDDTFMNNLLTGAVAKNTKMSNNELKQMAFIAADYMTVSKSMGKSMIETQNDLKEYLLTGNTTQLERDSILKGQMNTLEGQKTVSERILALDKAMRKEGYAGLSQLEIASIKWEEIKGKLQLAATTIGEKILPYVEKVFDWFLKLDEQTNGFSTLLTVAAGSIALIGLAMAPLVGATLSGYYAMKNYRIEAEKAAIANAVNKGPGTGVATAGGVAGTGASWASVAAGIGSIAAVSIAAGGALKVVNDALGGTYNSLKSMLSLLPSGAGGGGMVGAMLLGENFSAIDAILGVMGPIGQLWFTISGFWGSMYQIVPQIQDSFNSLNNVILSIPNSVNMVGASIYNSLVVVANALPIIFWNSVARIRSAFFSLPGAMSAAMSATYNNAVSWARSISSSVSSILSNISSYIGLNSRGPGTGAPRGPGIGLNYENYAGHKKNAWNAAGTGLSGNCVDMTLGLMSAYGGSMVSGTWNGGAHVWWQSPSGAQLDPARKALEGTWNPPARGPGSGNFGNVIINGDVYGFDDFKRKVEQANSSIGYDAGRF